MLTFIIEPSASSDREETQKALRELVRMVQDNPSVIAEAAAPLYGREVSDYDDAVAQYEEGMTLSTDDQTGSFRVRQRLKRIGGQRKFDEELRRTFCRMAISHCHQKGLDVDLKVV